MTTTKLTVDTRLSDPNLCK